MEATPAEPEQPKTFSLRITPDSEATLTLEKYGDVLACPVAEALNLLRAVDEAFPHFNFLDAVATYGLIIAPSADKAREQSMELQKAQHGCGGVEFSDMATDLRDRVLTAYMAERFRPYQLFYAAKPLSSAQLEQMASESDEPHARQRLQLFLQHTKVNVVNLVTLLASRAFWDDLCWGQFGWTPRIGAEMQARVKAFQQNFIAAAEVAGIPIEYPGFAVVKLEDHRVTEIVRAGINSLTGTPTEVPLPAAEAKPS